VGIIPPHGKELATVKLLGTGAIGEDAVVTRAPGAAFVLEGDLNVRGAPGGVALFATNGRDAVRAVILLVTPQRTIELVTSDALGVKTPLAGPIDAPSETSVHVMLEVNGTKIRAVIGTTAWNATVAKSVAKGDVGFVAQRGSHVSFSNFSLRASPAR
jgi:hypothetical protein